MIIIRNNAGELVPLPNNCSVMVSRLEIKRTPNPKPAIVISMEAWHCNQRSEVR